MGALMLSVPSHYLCELSFIDEIFAGYCEVARHNNSVNLLLQRRLESTYTLEMGKNLKHYGTAQSKSLDF